MHPAIAAARQRSDRVDAQVTELAGRLPNGVTVVALTGYGRRELTPHAEVDVLFLHEGHLTVADVMEKVCYPLWQQDIRAEAFVRTPREILNDARRSWATATRLVDARLVVGSKVLFETLSKSLDPWSRDVDRLRHHLRTEAQHRHAVHPSPAMASAPDLDAGRGGLADIHALQWLATPESERLRSAREFILHTIGALEDLTGHQSHRLTNRAVERLAFDAAWFERLYAHARWVAFAFDTALTKSPADRALGPNLAVRDGRLVADRPPPLARASSFGLRIANLVGLTPPSDELLDWASGQTRTVAWDAPALDQFWLMLRAADWRAWEWLDVTGLLPLYLPEMNAIWRKKGSARTGDLAIDAHSFLALRALHEWSETDDVFARRLWRSIRQRDWVYLATLLHELTADAASAVAVRVGLTGQACATIGVAVATYQLVLDTATRRDLHDEDLTLDLAARLGSRAQLSAAFLVAVAHELACGPGSWSPWKADLVRQLFGQLEVALRTPAEVGARRARSLEQRRERIVAELQRKNLYSLAPYVNRLPRRYVLTRTPALAARHLALLGRQPLKEGEVRIEANRRRERLEGGEVRIEANRRRDRLERGEVRIEANRRREAGLWDVLVVARDRPGLLATLAGVLSLRGISVLAADAATSSDGLVLDVFTVTGAEAVQWSQVEADLGRALRGEIPLHDLLGARPLLPEEAAMIDVSIDNAASQFFSLVEVRAPDQVGLLYRIASALHAQGLDIHHARIATHPDGALDVFYVRDLSGGKLSEPAARDVAEALTSRLRSPTIANSEYSDSHG